MTRQALRLLHLFDMDELRTALDAATRDGNWPGAGWRLSAFSTEKLKPISILYPSRCQLSLGVRVFIDRTVEVLSFYLNQIA